MRHIVTQLIIHTASSQGKTATLTFTSGQAYKMAIAASDAKNMHFPKKSEMAVIFLVDRKTPMGRTE